MKVSSTFCTIHCKSFKSSGFRSCAQTPSVLLLKRALQGVLPILILFDCVPFFELCQLFCDAFSIRQRAVTFPIQLGIGPTNMEARHCAPPKCTRRRCDTAVVGRAT